MIIGLSLFCHADGGIVLFGWMHLCIYIYVNICYQDIEGPQQVHIHMMTHIDLHVNHMVYVYLVVIHYVFL